MKQEEAALPSTIVIGYGNPGRKDDGLGPLFIEALQGQVPESIALHSNYQLTVEDAYELQHYQRVVFVDASMEGEQAYDLQKIESAQDEGLGSHSISPSGVVQLCETLYQHRPDAYILAIRGYEFDTYEEALSSQAEANLNSALIFFQKYLVESECLALTIEEER